MINTQTLAQHNQLYFDTVLAQPGKFTGFSITLYTPIIANIINSCNIQSVLDYGCGEAGAWKQHGLARLFGIDNLRLYDPSKPEYLNGRQRSDLVICTDVLEHIPEHLLDEVLINIAENTNKIMFLAISTRESSKRLINGQKAHQTVQPKSWWLEKLKIIKHKLVWTEFTHD